MAFIVSFPMIYLIYSGAFGKNLGYFPSVLPSGKAFLLALFVGLLIPLISSIEPIKRGLGVNLTESLNATRNKAKGLVISIVDNKALEITPYLFNGTVAVISGISVY